jgi:hypothetical protein
MEHLGFTSCKADPDVWIRENNGHTGDEFVKYVLIYTDDILAIGKDPSAILSRLNKYFALKEVQFGLPTNILMLIFGAPLAWTVRSSGLTF